MFQPEKEASRGPAPASGSQAKPRLALGSTVLLTAAPSSPSHCRKGTSSPPTCCSPRHLPREWVTRELSGVPVGTGERWKRRT